MALIHPVQHLMAFASICETLVHSPIWVATRPLPMNFQA
jgi:hypothetical protein